MRGLVSALLPAIFAVSLCAVGLFAQDAPPPPPAGRGGGRGGPPKNLQILKPEEIRPVMGAFVTGTGMKCDGCHVAGDFASDDKHEKVMARKMLAMVRGLNADNFGGKDAVTCYTCHRGEGHPKTAPEKTAPEQK